MRKALFRFALLALAFGFATPAAAQFGPQTGPTSPGGAFWQGAYVGANLGYQWGATTNNRTDPWGPAGGFQAGYNWQRGQFVYGAEADMQWSGADDTFAPWKFSNPWFGTVRGRAGWSMSNILLYGTLGLAYGTLKAHNIATGTRESKSHIGWAAGAGIEVSLTGNWSARAEYLYVDFSDRYYLSTGASHGLQSSLLRMGVNYRF
jgi:outer membrane immunogenic protein